ncbi:MAG: phosphorylase, partial [Proteobacteria bacterium]|nr:phosphorylase [Pseudomonadota bacterium]
MPAKKKTAPVTCKILEPLPSDAAALVKDLERYQFYHQGRLHGCPKVYCYQSLSWTLRDRIMSDWMNSYTARDKPGSRRAYSLSLVFLIGRALGNHVLNLGLEGSVREAL